MLKNETVSRQSLVLIALCVLMYGVFFCCMPMYADDLWYSIHIKEGFNWHNLWKTWMEHFQTDNSRLANLVMVPFLTLPKWVGSGLATLAWGYVILRAPALLNPPKAQTMSHGLSCLQLSLWLSGTAFLLPWYDTQGALCYQFNYVLSSAFYVWVIALFLADKGRVMWFFLAGILAGAWHEGFALPTLGGMAVTMLLHKPLRTSRNIALTAGLAIGVLWLFCCPGFLVRIEAMRDINSAQAWTHVLFKKCVSHPAYVLLLLTLSVRALRHRFNKSRQGQIIEYPFPANFRLLVLIATLSFLLHIVTTVSPRTGWWCELLSILLLSRLWRIQRRWRTAAASILLVLTGLHMLLVDYYSVCIGRDFRAAIEQYRRDRNATVFMDFHTESDAPALTVMAPDFTLFLAPVYRSMHNQYLFAHEPDGQGLVVVPKSLEKVTARSGKPLGGNLGVRSVDGAMIVEADSVPAERLNKHVSSCAEFMASVTFGDDSSLLGSHTVGNVRMLYIPFISKADGRRYAYLYPWRQVLSTRIFGDPAAVSIPLQKN